MHSIHAEKVEKEAGAQPSDEPWNCTPAFVVSEVWKIEPFSPHILGYREGWEIIRGCLQKADTEERTADFQPLSLQFTERLEQ